MIRKYELYDETIVRIIEGNNVVLLHRFKEDKDSIRLSKCLDKGLIEELLNLRKWI